MHRLFVALRPPPEVREALLATMEGVPHARWQDEDQLHLTLRYIGEVERGVAEDVAVALGTIHAPAQTVALAGVGRFDTRGRTTTLWAGVTPHDGLRALHRKVDQALARVGLPHEGRSFLPHITLARLSRGAGSASEIESWLAAHMALTSHACTASHFLLYESHLGADGATYDAVARWPLEAATA